MNRLFLLLFGAVSLVAHAQVPDYVPTDGLVAWYPFNGNANDESGNGNDAVVIGADDYEDRFGNGTSALNFASADDWVDTPTLITGSEYTLQVWALFPLPITEDGHNTFISDFNLGAEADLMFMSFHEICGLALGDQYASGNCIQGIYGTNLLSSEIDDGWHLITLTSFNGLTQFFVDGVPYTTVNHAVIGTIECLGNNAADQGVAPQNAGVLDDIGFWDRSLTDEEVLGLYLAEVSTAGCTDTTACNFDAEATIDDGSCIPSGCMEPLACNYNALAECAGEACDYTCCPGPGCCSAGMYWDYDLEQCMNYETCQDDLDGDGVIGVNDLMQLLSSFGTDCAPAEEPATSEFTCGNPVNYHGYDYATVQIGEQCWFAENCRHLPSVSPSSQGSYSEPYAYVHGYQGFNLLEAIHEQTFSDFGVLYNQPASVVWACPTSWRVPSDEDWTELELFLGIEDSVDSVGYRGTNQGDQLKSSPNSIPPWNGTDDWGFRALPGQYRSRNGNFGSNGVEGRGYYWSETAHDDIIGVIRVFDGVETGIYRGFDHLSEGFSVRCVKD